jgi:hypothetical protein
VSVRLTPSAVALVLANLIPLGGVVLLGWEVFPILLLFWLENVIVGVFNVLRMVWVQPDDEGGLILKIFTIPFFILHYGLFTAGHGVFVFMLFGGGQFPITGFPSVVTVVDALVQLKLVLPALALAASHGFSFVSNYVAGQEYRRVTLQQLMHRPYSRVVVLHLVIIGGGFLVMALNSPVLGLFLLVVLKVGIDVRAHVREHAKVARPRG